MKKCMYCKKEIVITKNSRNNIFCSRSCSSKYHANKHFYELNHSYECEVCNKKFKTKYAIKKGRHIRCDSCKRKVSKPKKRIISILQVSKRTTSKILQRLNLKCFNCEWDKTICDIHHIVSRKNGGTDDHSNLTYLCPNCHRLAHNNKLKKFINLEEKLKNVNILEFYNCRPKK